LGIPDPNLQVGAWGQENPLKIDILKQAPVKAGIHEGVMERACTKSIKRYGKAVGKSVGT